MIARCQRLVAKRARLVFVALMATTSVFAGCDDDQPLRVEIDSTIAFDPTRFDAGVAPPKSDSIPTVVRFGITPFYSKDRQRRMLGRIERYLSERTGTNVVATIFPNYESCVAALVRGELEIAQLSPYAFVRAQAQLDDLLPLATSVAQGSMTYGSYLVARRESNINTWRDIPGTRMAFVDALSSSGYLYPRIFLEERGLNLDKDLASASFYGMHDLALQALIEGKVDVAAVSSDSLVSAGVMGIHGPVRVVAKAGRIPYDAVVVRKSMDPWLLWALRDAFLHLSIHDKEGREVLEDYNLINGFMPVPENHYNEVRRRANKLGPPLTNVVAPALLLPAQRPVPAIDDPDSQQVAPK